jgi:hypothetical protein
MIRTLLLAIILFPRPDGTAAAQAADSLRSARETIASSLRVGEQLRVQLTGEQIQGILTAYAWPELHLDTETSLVVVPLPSVQALWVRGTAAKQGALLGVVAGALVGAAMGLFVGEVICDGPDCQASTAGTVVTFGALGAGAGVGVGALVGLAVPKWHARFP